MPTKADLPAKAIPMSRWSVAAAILWGSPNRLSPRKRSEVRKRLLAAASLMLYAEGINNVGIERSRRVRSVLPTGAQPSRSRGVELRSGSS
jgi:hypothetical protein